MDDLFYRPLVEVDLEVSGGPSISSGSGKKILDELNTIIDLIGKSGSLHGLEINIDKSKLQDELSDLKLPSINIDLNELTEANTILKEIKNELSGLGNFLQEFSNIGTTIKNIFSSIDKDMNLKEELASFKNQIDLTIKELSNLTIKIDKAKQSTVIVNDNPAVIDKQIERMTTLQDVARKTISYYSELFELFSSKGGRIAYANLAQGKYGAEGKKIVSGLQDIDFDRMLNRVGNAKSPASLSNMIATMQDSIGVLSKAFEDAGMKIPDSGKIDEAISKYKEFKNEVSGIDEKAVEEPSKTFSEATTKTLNDLSDKLEQLRKKIEATFDFSTIDLHDEELIEKLNVLSNKITEVNKGLVKAGIKPEKVGGVAGGDDVTVRGEGLSKEDRAVLKEMTRVRLQLASYQKKGIKEATRNGQFVKTGRDGNPDFEVVLGENEQLLYDYAQYLATRLSNVGRQLNDYKAAHNNGAIQNEYEAIEKGIEEEVQLTGESYIRTAKQSWANLTEKINQELGRKSFAEEQDPMVKQMADEIRSVMNDTSDMAYTQYDKLKKMMADLNLYMREHNITEETSFQKLTRNFASRLRTIVTTAMITMVSKKLHEVYQNIVNIDTALTQLSIVTQKSRKEIKEFADTFYEAAQTVGASASDLINSATTFSRLGYSLEESTEFARLTAEYAKVAATDVSSATTSITTIIKAFGVSSKDLESVLDKLMYVGQNFPISAEELGVGFQNAGSALVAAGNSIEQSIALLTAANAQIQDISKVSTALRTIVARINRSTADLEAVGESIADIPTQAKLQEFMSAFGISISKGNGELRNTYDILVDISKIWGDLNGEQQASIAEKLAGTRQQSIFMGMMNSMQSEAVKVMNEIDNATGSLAKANEQRLDSVQGRLDQAQARWEEISTRLLESDFVKNVINLLDGFLNGFNEFLRLWDGHVASIVGVVTAVNVLLATIHSSKIFATLGSKITEIISPFKALYYTIKQTKAEAQGLNKEADEFGKKLESAGGSKSAGFGIASLIITAIVAAIALLISALKTADKAWQKYYETAKNNYDLAKKNVDEIQNEIDALKALQKSYEEAKGDKERLAELYPEINAKVKDSIGVLTDEANAYQRINLELQDQIKYQEILLKQEQKKKQEAAVDKYATNRLVRTGILGIDWLASDLSSEKINRLVKNNGNTISQERFENYIRTLAYRNMDYGEGLTPETSELMKPGFLPGSKLGALGYLGQAVAKLLGAENVRGYWDIELNSLLFDNIDLENDIDYEMIENLSDTLKDEFFKVLGIDQADWEQYWEDQVETMLEILGDEISDYVKNNDLYGNESFYNQVIKSLVLHGYNAEEIISYLNNIEPQLAKLNNLSNYYYNAVTNSAENSADAYGQLQSMLLQLQGEVPELSNVFKVLADSITYTANSAGQFTVEAETVLQILNKIQGPYDKLVSAIKSLSETNMLTPEGLSSLLSLQSEFKDLNFNISDYIERTADGFRLAEGTYEAFIEAVVEGYKNDIRKATEETLPNAIENLKNLRAVLITLMETEKAQKQKDALNNQLDLYKKLIDIRKELLKTYQEELNYQKELSKKQQNVSDLQTKLMISRLDDTEAGRARTRELEKELADAEEDLYDTTLDHAIEKITDQLDKQYEEYEKMIKDKLQKLEEGVTKISSDEWLNSLIEGISEGIADGATRLLPSSSPSGGGPSRPGNTWNGSSFSGTPSTTAYFDALKERILEINSRGNLGYHSSQAYYDAINEYKDKLSYEDLIALYTLLQELGLTGQANKVSNMISSSNMPIDPETLFNRQLGDMFENIGTKYRTLISPTTGGARVNTFNSPLIEINCDNVTNESMPALKRVVDDAVAEVKKQLDSGMSRTGRLTEIRRLNI